MRNFRLFELTYLVAALAFAGACRPPEPVQHRIPDLGTAEAPLPPPPQAWHDPEIVKGTADWPAFRKPESAEEKVAVAKPKQGEEKAEGEANEEGSDVEKEIRELAADYGKALAENKLDEVTEFLNDAQAEYSENVFAAVNKLVEQLRALKEAAPALSEKMDQLAPALNLIDVLKIEIETVRVVDEKNATAQLAGGKEIKVVVGEKDFWYLESPGLAHLEKERSRIEKLAGDIEAALAKGAPDEAAITALGTGIDELRTALAGLADKPEGESG